MKLRPTLLLALLLGALPGCARSREALIECGRQRPAALQVDSSVTLRLDFAGAEAIIRALERDALSDAEVDALLRVHGARAMVDNVTRFIPGLGVPEFRSEI